MTRQPVFEAISRTLKDWENGDAMAGLTVILTGDFRQMLPVIPRGTHADEVKYSYYGCCPKIASEKEHSYTTLMVIN